MGKKILRLFLVIATLSLSGSVYAQEGGGGDPPVNKHYEKQKKKRDKEAKDARAERLKRHEKIQDKKTRKRMKKNKKKAERLKKNKGEPFFQRVFRKK